MPSKERTYLMCASIRNPFRLVCYILFNPLLGIPFQWGHILCMELSWPMSRSVCLCEVKLSDVKPVVSIVNPSHSAAT